MGRGGAYVKQVATGSVAAATRHALVVSRPLNLNTGRATGSLQMRKSDPTQTIREPVSAN